MRKKYKSYRALLMTLLSLVAAGSLVIIVNAQYKKTYDSNSNVRAASFGVEMEVIGDQEIDSEMIGLYPIGGQHQQTYKVRNTGEVAVECWITANTDTMIQSKIEIEVVDENGDLTYKPFESFILDKEEKEKTILVTLYSAEEILQPGAEYELTLDIDIKQID